jgi:acyl carrier protein
MSIFEDLGVFGIASEQPLAESGMNSMLAFEFRTRLSQQFCVNIPPTFIFEYPTISAIEQYLAASIPNPTRAPPGRPARATVDV